MDIILNEKHFQAMIVVLFLLLIITVFIYKNKVKSFFRLFSKYLPFSSLRVIFLKLGGVEIGTGVVIGSNNFFGKNVSIGNNVIIDSNNIISNSQIGDDSILNQNILMSRTHLETGVHIHRGVKFNCENGVKIGKYSNILQYCCFEGISEVSIGECSEISSFCNFYTVSSIQRALTKKSRDSLEDDKLESELITIGNNVWFGPLVTVYPGVSIGSHSGILSNSAVISDVPKLKLVGGVPAKVKRNITIAEGKINLNK